MRDFSLHFSFTPGSGTVPVFDHFLLYHLCETLISIYWKNNFLVEQKMVKYEK